MTSKWALTTAVFINYVLGFSIFIAPDTNQLSYIGPIPGLIILISLAVLFSEVPLIPARYKKEYTRISFILELILSLLLLEFFIVKVWTKIEGIIFSIMKFLVGVGNLYEEMGGDGFMSLLISGIALSFLCYAVSATNSTEAILESVVEIFITVKTLYVKSKQVFSRQPVYQSQPEIQTCNMGPQSTKYESAQAFQCVPVKSPVTQPSRRNPNCPIHGDHEINHHAVNTPPVTKRRNVY